MAGWIREQVKKITRSKGWNAVRKLALQRDQSCRCCSTLKELQVHHKKPFHLHPELELDLENLITLCDRCHLLVGHLCNYKSYNIQVEEDSNLWRMKVERRP